MSRERSFECGLGRWRDAAKEDRERAVPRYMVENMQPNSVIVDIPVDEDGCFETSERFLKTGEQIFKKCGVWHICVPNMPGIVPKTSTPVLCRETFPYVKEIAQKGFERAVRENPALASGVVTHKGWLTHETLARDVGRMDRYKLLNKLL